jgi:hypothetical protein
MKTDRLIDLLGTNVESVKGGRLRSTLLIALVVGAVVAICLMLAIFGVPTEGFTVDLGPRVLGLAFTLGVVALGAGFLMRAARPGKPGRWPLFVMALLFLAVLCAAIVALASAAPAAWGGMIFGPQWTTCLICVPLFAAAPFASLVAALRRGAPTSLALTGAVTGLIAGALGAAVFAFHHPGASVPFILIWYVGPIALCGFAGAMLGPRLLRW